MNLSFLSICSGLECASLAWAPLGWRACGFAEIDPFCVHLLHQRHGAGRPRVMPDPDAGGLGDERAARRAAIRAVKDLPEEGGGPPNFGDFTAIDLALLPERVDVLVGGTPCQGFSIAGKRGSLADDRSNLALAYVTLAHDLARSHRLKNLVWENVPGILSTDDNAFGCFLGALVGHGDALPPPFRARWPDAGMVDGPWARAAWRLLDAQYFGVPQRRERIFVVADFGDGADPAEVLFEHKSLRRDFAPRDEARERVAGTLKASLGKRCGQADETDTADPLIAHTLTAHSGRIDGESEAFIAHMLRADGFDASEDGTGRGTPLVPVAFNCKASASQGDGAGLIAPSLRAMDGSGGGQVAVAFDLRGREGGAQVEGPHDTANIRAASGGSSRSYVADAWAVRRLTPVECERLQGVPDNHTRIAWRGRPEEECPDGPRYRALGNSWARPVVEWIGRRMDAALARREESEA